MALKSNLPQISFSKHAGKCTFKEVIKNCCSGWNFCLAHGQLLMWGVLLPANLLRTSPQLNNRSRSAINNSRQQLIASRALHHSPSVPD
eukprot:1157817-Pelagomonas_calceolata.AAC.5